MKNYVAQGDIISVTAPDDSDDAGGVAGAGVLVGNLFGIAVGPYTKGTDVLIKTTGVFDVTKVGTQAWAQGVTVYWDDENQRATTTAGSLKKIGQAVTAVGAGAGETIGRVRLQGFAS